MFLQPVFHCEGTGRAGQQLVVKAYQFRAWFAATHRGPDFKVPFQILSPLLRVAELPFCQQSREGSSDREAYNAWYKVLLEASRDAKKMGTVSTDALPPESVTDAEPSITLATSSQIPSHPRLALGPLSVGEMPTRELEVAMDETDPSTIFEVASSGLSKAQKWNMRRKRKRLEAKELPSAPADSVSAPPPSVPSAVAASGASPAPLATTGCEALVFKLDSFVITKAEQTWSTQFQVLSLPHYTYVESVLPLTHVDVRIWRLAAGHGSCTITSW